ncbi:hypothetical protein [Mitsuaria sp. 7]|uniref:hypothetical protein n=1 Tax=Mitsuaria sp. 7 TaxID=1658665 RepID=UPI0007DE0B9C|nr:hypothetical protein [Mitsuaria sp. 7]ANH67554.1 hypothetical protein ABE85_08210 [Mitsuaria sp. 7]
MCPPPPSSPPPFPVIQPTDSLDEVLAMPEGYKTGRNADHPSTGGALQRFREEGIPTCLRISLSILERPGDAAAQRQDLRKLSQVVAAVLQRAGSPSAGLELAQILMHALEEQTRCAGADHDALIGNLEQALVDLWRSEQACLQLDACIHELRDQVPRHASDPRQRRLTRLQDGLVLASQSLLGRRPDEADRTLAAATRASAVKQRLRDALMRLERSLEAAVMLDHIHRTIEKRGDAGARLLHTLTGMESCLRAMESVAHRNGDDPLRRATAEVAARFDCAGPGVLLTAEAAEEFADALRALMRHQAGGHRDPGPLRRR